LIVSYTRKEGRCEKLEFNAETISLTEMSTRQTNRKREEFIASIQSRMKAVLHYKSDRLIRKKNPRVYV